MSPGTLPGKEIHDLENAPAGASAEIPGVSQAPRLVKRGRGDVGRPWITEGADDPMTTSYAYLRGYRTEARPQKMARRPRNPTTSAAREHLVLLHESGWTYRDIDSALGFRPQTTIQFVSGVNNWERSKERAAQVFSISPFEEPYVAPSLPERLDDFEFLVKVGVEPREASIRCGFAKEGAKFEPSRIVRLAQRYGRSYFARMLWSELEAEDDDARESEAKAEQEAKEAA